MSVEEGPRGNDSEEGKASSTQSDEERELDILEKVANDEGNGLEEVSYVVNGAFKVESMHTPTIASSAVPSSSANF